MANQNRVLRGGPDLSGGDDLGEGVVEDGLVGDQVQEVDTVHVERQDVLTALQRVIITPHLQRGNMVIEYMMGSCLSCYRKEA